MKKKAILEIEFDPEKMADEADVVNAFGGSWFRVIEYLLKEDGLGIFDEELRLVDVVEVPEQTGTKK